MSSLPEPAPESTEAAALTSAATCELCGYHAPVAAFHFVEFFDVDAMDMAYFVVCANQLECGRRLWEQMELDLGSAPTLRVYFPDDQMPF